MKKYQTKKYQTFFPQFVLEVLEENNSSITAKLNIAKGPQIKAPGIAKAVLENDEISTGELVKLKVYPRVPLPLIMAVVFELDCLYKAIAIYDLEATAYTVVSSHSYHYEVGDNLE